MSVKYYFLCLIIMNFSANAAVTSNDAPVNSRSLNLDYKETVYFNKTKNPLENLPIQKSIGVSSNSSLLSRQINNNNQLLFASNKYIPLGEHRRFPEQHLPTVEAATEMNLYPH